MTNDFDNLKDVFTMAEVLSSESDDSLEILTVDERSNKTARVIFNFNNDKELVEVYVEE